MLLLTLKIGQSIDIPGVGRIELRERSGRCVKLGFALTSKTQEIKLLPMPGDTKAAVPVE